MRRAPIIAIFALALAACGESATTTTAGITTTAEQPATTAATEAPPVPAMGPAEIGFEDQTSDGSEVVIASVTLPSAGFVVIHADGGGSPGAVIGHSDLLPSGTSTNVTVTLDEPLSASGTVYPMVHIDANQNGVYEFFPPGDTTDAPGQFADGAVAVIAGSVTVAEMMGPILTVAGSPFGSILTDGEGNTLYIFLPDNQGEPTCYDQCAANWPPLTGEVAPGDGVDAGLFDTVERTDGSAQVTYKGWPLYYFAADAAPGDTNGQGVGDVWWVINPAGEVVQG